MDYKKLLKPKIIIPVVIGILLFIPILQNMQRVFLQFYFWEIRISQALLIILIFLFGSAAGIGFVYLMQYMKKKKADKEN
ncbi:MAG: LapA family protein [Calditrichia bacterium]|nr:LapA family protein [Calditrichia bacterium]